jgi:hypothetical protein
MNWRGRAAAIAAVAIIAAALSACSPLDRGRVPAVADLPGLRPAEVLSMLGQPDLKRNEPPAELWQYRAADCVLNLFFYDDAGNYRLDRVEAWERSLAGDTPVRCEDENAPIKAHLVSR